MKVIISGATGFVGKKLVRYMVESGDQVVVIVRDKKKLEQSIINKVSIIEAELARAIQFGEWAENPICISQLKVLALKFGIDYNKNTIFFRPDFCKKPGRIVLFNFFPQIVTYSLPPLTTNSEYSAGQKVIKGLGSLPNRFR